MDVWEVNARGLWTKGKDRIIATGKPARLIQQPAPLLPLACVGVPVAPYLFSLSVLEPFDVPLAIIDVAVTIWTRSQNI